MFHRVSHLAVITALTAAGAAGSACAQAQNDAPIELGTITLSALRYGADIARTGVSVSVVDRAELDKSADLRLADFLGTLPGVSVISQGGFGANTALRIRGFDGRHIAVYIDGIRIDDPSGVQVSTDFGALMTDDIARIEVLRGSQSALWGGSAVAGVINISTLSGAEPGLHQKVRIEGGSHSSARLAWGLTQKDELLELALNASHFRTDGISAYDGGTEADGAEASRLSFSARYQVSDLVTLGGAAFRQKSRSDYDGYIDTDGDGYTDTFTDLPNEMRRQDLGLRLFAELETGNTLHVLGIGVSRNKRDMEDENGKSAFAGERLTLDWQATSTLSDQITLSYGADFNREKAKTSAMPGGTGDTDTKGIWGQLAWSPREGFDVTAALRYDDHSAFGGFGTGRLSFAWAAAEGLTLRGAVARGFRAPSLDELYGDYPGLFFTGNPDLDPETSVSYELGADYAFGTGASLSLTAFRIEVKDRIAADPATFWSTLGNLAGSSVSKGVELAAKTRLSDALSLTLAYTYTDGRDPNGARLTAVPRHNLALALDAEISERVSARFTLSHLAGRRDRHVNSVAALDMPDVTLLDAAFSYQISDSIEATLRIENLADEHWQSSHGYGTPGRTAWLGLQARF